MSNEPRAFVTGTSSGIGQAVALELLAGGWQVTGVDITPASITHDLFEAVAVDLRDGAATDAAARGAAGATAFVHAAGILRIGALGTLSAGDAQAMWEIHVAAATRIANILVPFMTAAGAGSVVLVGSRVARGIAGRSQYAATKAALVSLARSWAAESIRHGVTVNVVSPAATRTAMQEDPARKSLAARVPPIGRLIEPAEVASLVAYLLSPAARAITGQDIQVCGGASLVP